jgi:hypothetical protein
VVDWGGKVAAWFAAVTGVSATLAALVAAEVKQPLHGGMRALFAVLVIISAVSFLALLLTGPPALWSAWRSRTEAKRRRPDPAKPSVSYEGFTLELADASKWELWQGRALIAEVQVRVTNNTPGRVITLMSPDLESDPGPFWAERPRLAPEEVRALFDEIVSRSPMNPHMDLKPGESRVIRVVSDAFLPYPAGEGRPYCEFMVTNAEGAVYALPIPTGSPDGGHMPELMRLRNLAMNGRLLREQIQGRKADTAVTMADPDEARRYQYWMTRVASALRPWPELQAQFQAGRAAATDRDPAWVAQRTDLLEEMLRTLDGHPRPDALHTPLPNPRDLPSTSQQRSALAHVRRCLDEGRSLQADLDRAPPPTVPPGLPDRLEGWEMTVRAGLESIPDQCARFEAAKFVRTQDVPAQLSNRLRARLLALETIEQELREEAAKTDAREPQP